jgi:hypothetical protein
MKFTSIFWNFFGFYTFITFKKTFLGLSFPFHFWSKLCRTTTIKFCEKFFEKKVKYKTIKLNNTFETSDSMDFELLFIRFHKADPSGFLIGSEELKYFSANRPFSMIKVY